jgi:hypothetical protein
LEDVALEYTSQCLDKTKHNGDIAMLRFPLYL